MDTQPLPVVKQNGAIMDDNEAEHELEYELITWLPQPPYPFEVE